MKNTDYKKIRKIRLMKGHTQETVAALLGVTVTTISRWERGVSWPPKQKLYQKAVEDYINN